MRVLIVNNHTTHLHSIKKLFSPHDILVYISYRQIGGYPLDDVDVVVLTGSNNHTFSSKTFAKEVHMLHQSGKAVIGICLGCELLVSAFGGIIERNVERIQGDISITCENDAKSYVVHESHRYCVIALGNDLHALAKSSYGYEILQHNTKPIIGFQFHPEVLVPSNDGFYLFQRYTKKLFEEIAGLPWVETEE